MTDLSSFARWSHLSRRRADLEQEELAALRQVLSEAGLELLDASPAPKGRWNLTIGPEESILKMLGSDEPLGGPTAESRAEPQTTTPAEASPAPGIPDLPVAIRAADVDIDEVVQDVPLSHMEPALDETSLAADHDDGSTAPDIYEQVSIAPPLPDFDAAALPLPPLPLADLDGSSAGDSDSPEDDAEEDPAKGIADDAGGESVDLASFIPSLVPIAELGEEVNASDPAWPSPEMATSAPPADDVEASPEPVAEADDLEENAPSVPTLALPESWEQFFAGGLELAGGNASPAPEPAAPQPLAEPAADHLSIPDLPAPESWSNEALPSWLTTPSQESRREPVEATTTTPDHLPAVDEDDGLLLTLTPASVPAPQIVPASQSEESSDAEWPALPPLPSMDVPADASSNGVEDADPPAAAKNHNDAEFVDIESLADRESSATRVTAVGKRRPNPLKDGAGNPQDRAVRLARTLASDMKGYRQEDYQTALASGVETLREAFRDDIADARGRFYDQVSAADVANRDSIFTAAVNEILGKGLSVL